MQNDSIYLDNNSTTQLDDRVLTIMLPYLKGMYGNASSIHNFGLEINKAIIDARSKVASLINSNSKEIIFTSGATESINLALKGLAFHPNNIKKHIITVETEHKAVLDTCKYLETVGFDITYLKVNQDGLIDCKQLTECIRKDTLLICVMLVNNETGVIQPVREISNIARANRLFFVCDATQAVGKIPIDLTTLQVDLMAFSAHKFYGPKGVGGLYINKGTSGKSLLPLLHGGGHEGGFRSGTLNVPAIVGFGEACVLASQEMGINAEKITAQRELLEAELLKIDGSCLNGDKSQRIYNTSNIYFPSIDANVLIGQLKTIALSNGSACTAALVEPSHVLKAMGLSDEAAYSSIRFSLGKYNTDNDIAEVVKQVKQRI